MLQITLGRSLIYSTNSVGPRMDPRGTPELSGYSLEDFPSRTTQSCLLLRKEKIRPNIWPEIFWDLSLWRRQACPTLWKALDISSAADRVASDLLKAEAILSETTFGWSRRPKTILEIREMIETGHIPLNDQ